MRTEDVMVAVIGPVERDALGNLRHQYPERLIPLKQAMLPEIKALGIEIVQKVLEPTETIAIQPAPPYVAQVPVNSMPLNSAMGTPQPVTPEDAPKRGPGRPAKEKA